MFIKIMRIFGIILALFAVATARGEELFPDETGASAVVVYNSRMPESKAVAQHYAARREVPANQILGLKLPMTENMTRVQYQDDLESPLRRFLDTQKLLTFDVNNATGARKLKEGKLRYVVLCYGVPLRIEDTAVKEPEELKVREEFRRNGAAVDSELCLLPWTNTHHMLVGFLPNPVYGATNPAEVGPAKGVLIVARLDGPTPEIANALVDKAMEAETNGLWGRAYFDMRGRPKGDALRMGDDWIHTAAVAAHNYGFDTVVDEKEETFSAGFPMSQIALYAGWYNGDVSGPFTQPKVEFMPGAFAYHLHSFSANTLRSTTNNWCGPLLADGATATMGCVNEPYLMGTPNLAIFFTRWLAGFTFGEAACASQGPLSWQTTVVGDPLYRPFGHDPRRLHESLLERHNPLIVWSYLRIVNLSLVHGVAPAKLIDYLQNMDLTSQSAVLTEKLGDLCQMAGQRDLAIKSWQQALKLDPTPLQSVRLTLLLADKLEQADKEEEALALYDAFLKQNPTYPDARPLYEKMETLARKLEKFQDFHRYAKEIERLNASAK